MIIVVIGLVVFGLIFLQNYLYEKFWARGLMVDIKFSAKEAFEGDSLFLQQKLINNKLLPLPWVFVKFFLSTDIVFKEDRAIKYIGDAKYQGGLFSLKARQSIRRKLEFECSRRGLYSFKTVDVYCGNLLHNKRFGIRLNHYRELVVFPKLIRDDSNCEVLFKNLDAAVSSNSLINPDPFEFIGIREYQPTDPMRNINFKATAIVGGLMVNMHAPTSSKRLEIVLDTSPNAKYPSYELYEQIIRLAGTMADKYIKEDVSLGFYTNGIDISANGNVYVPSGGGPKQIYAILQALARINLVLKTRDIIAHLNSIQNNNESPVYIIITAHWGTDLQKAVEDMRARGFDVFVVAACEAGGPVIDDEGVFAWEAV